LPIQQGTSAQKIQALVQVERVSKRYETATALDELTLDVFEGETLGLLGPNGAGKTTLMHLLAGLLRPDSGSVRIAGLGDPQSRRVRAAIGLAPQELAVYPQLSAEENLRFFGRLYGLRGAELQAGAERALRLADLTARASDRASTFSGGMKRRLNLACALVHRPTLLLLDEPTAGIDPHSRNRLFEAVERLRSEGLTLVYSTHLMEEPERLCDRVAIIDHGRLVREAATADLLASFTLDQLRVVIGGADDLTGLDLAGLPGVQSVEPTARDGDVRTYLLRIDPDAAKRVQRAVTTFAAERDLTLSENGLVRLDLEDVFLRLIDTKERAA
jgi:ABC-2 type transport system ATP-binding protein